MNLTNAEVVKSFDSNDFNVLFSRANGSYDPKYYTTGKGVRTYPKNTISISGKYKINTIKLVLHSTTDLEGDIKSDNGKITASTEIEKEIKEKEGILIILSNNNLNFTRSILIFTIMDYHYSLLVNYSIFVRYCKISFNSGKVTEKFFLFFISLPVS